MNAAMLAKVGVASGAAVKLGAVTLVAQLDAGLPDGTVRIAAAHASTVALGPLFANLTVEKA
jgi:NADH-quinone oxidoreductase subunit G